MQAISPPPFDVLVEGRSLNRSCTLVLNTLFGLYADARSSVGYLTFVRLAETSSSCLSFSRSPRYTAAP